MDYQIALKRLNLVKGHIQLSENAKKELATSTINIPHAQEKLWSTLPQGYFEVIE